MEDFSLIAGVTIGVFFSVVVMGGGRKITEYILNPITIFFSLLSVLKSNIIACSILFIVFFVIVGHRRKS